MNTVKHLKLAVSSHPAAYYRIPLSLWLRILLTLTVALLPNGFSTSSAFANPVPDGPAVVIQAGSLMISEFRLRGPNGANDEFIEIYNDTGADHTVASVD